MDGKRPTPFWLVVLACLSVTLFGYLVNLVFKILSERSLPL